MIPIDCRVSALPDLGVLDVSGQDAHAFLSAQLSQRIPDPDSGSACLAAWHDPKGRVRSLCRVLAVPGSWLLITERASLSALVLQLSRYVLRADVHLVDASESWSSAALLHAADSRAKTAGAVANPEGQARQDALHAIRIGPGITYLLGAPSRLAAACAPLQAAESDAAACAEIELGLPPLKFWSEPKFLGQMLNLDRLGAIAFDKGCFPGQEILTRAHRLGDVRRRLHRYGGQRPPPQTGVLLLDSTRRPVGEVVRAVQMPGGCELLAVSPADDRDAALVCDDAPDAPLRRLPLPTDAPGDTPHSG